MVHGRHQKRSRAGCLTCKLRKVKCDEARPICGNCKRYFRNAGACYWDVQDASATNQARLESRLCQAYQHGRIPVALDLKPSNGSTSSISSEETRLFHHFTSVTCETLPLCPEPAALNLWARAIPQIAFEHGYLRSAVLATAALHYHSLRPDDASMLSRASHFYGRTLRALSKDMAGPSSTTAEPLVMASLLISLLSSRFTRTLSCEQSFTPALEYFRVAKGNAALLRATVEWIKSSSLKGYLELRSQPSTSASSRSGSSVSGHFTRNENPSSPKPCLFFVHQRGPVLDNHAVSTVRSRVMVDYRSRKRKPATQQSSPRESISSNILNKQQDQSVPSNGDIIPEHLLDTIAPPGDPKFSYLLQDLSPNHSDYGVYSTYVAQLNSTLLAIKNGEPKHFIRRRCSTMPVWTPEEFIKLVEKKDERALVMMMHHYALLKLVGDVWWMQGTAEYNFEGLKGMVGEKWDCFLERPRTVMEFGRQKSDDGEEGTK